MHATEKNPVKIRVIATVAAGDLPLMSHAGGAVEIMTGAVMPEGLYDAVVRLEDVDRIGDSIFLRKPVRPGENVRRKGSDIQQGLALVQRGTVLSAEHILALASVGCSELPVFVRPRVAIIPTGKELVSWDCDELKPGQIRNSTSPFLVATLRSVGATVDVYPIVADQPDIFRKTLADVIEKKYDVVISTGAVSAGKFDFVLSVLNQIEASVHFHKCAIRPGKPILFADLPGGTAFFGLPGNTVSTAVGYRFFIWPYLRKILSRDLEPNRKLMLADGVRKPDGLRCFFKAKVEQSATGDRVKVLSGQASFMVLPLLTADSWVVLPESADHLDSGAMVDVYPLMGN
jgi:molybdopterin molybdotransferase